MKGDKEASREREEKIKETFGRYQPSPCSRDTFTMSFDFSFLLFSSTRLGSLCLNLMKR
jgi:hypothetical protein